MTRHSPLARLVASLPARPQTPKPPQSPKTPSTPESPYDEEALELEDYHQNNPRIANSRFVEVGVRRNSLSDINELERLRRINIAESKKRNIRKVRKRQALVCLVAWIIIGVTLPLGVWGFLKMRDGK